ncbi:geranylgeranyl diphosphate synthase, type II [Microbacterium sp. cf046]|uniref:polyprenyl synthetase family protein n=1 Tax=Microbacterium sp. cf046 TaxID=1761803 RepID=UPI0008E0C867|nr:polyprenyl synthetase family protein [Microbacterium sp. cf046]SFS07973.1 geranylgeranyl diphosphate synthase, type II [Microbacterium sp. cf046]
MIPLATRAAIDETIDCSMSRIRRRSIELGGGFEELGDAVGRAAMGGKRFRPALVAASFAAFGGELDEANTLYSVAAAFELLHTAFVVHDDVIDHDTIRRGIPNVAGEFRRRARDRGADAAGAATLGDAAAILAGDLLLHEASRLIALADVSPGVRAELFGLLDDAIYVSAAGELADVENAVMPDYAEAEAIFNATFNKTAVYSFSAPLCAGAVLAGAPAEAVAALDAEGGRLGLAFQLVDDLIGAFGSAEQAGRDEGGDLRESKRTPLIALARQTPSWSRVNDALAVAHTGPIAVREAQLALEESGARVRLRMLIDDTLAGVRSAADDPAFPADARPLIRDLADRVEERIP